MSVCDPEGGMHFVGGVVRKQIFCHRPQLTVPAPYGSARRFADSSADEDFKEYLDEVAQFSTTARTRLQH